MLKDDLKEWTDFDVAEFALACDIGLMAKDIDPYPKFIFWSNNSVGTSLSIMLASLVDSGVLEMNDDVQYRWNPNFKGEWEKCSRCHGAGVTSDQGADVCCSLCNGQG